MEILLYIIHILGIVFFSWLFWIFLQMAFAAWGSKKAKEKWIAMVNTPYFQIIGVKWLSVILVVGVGLQLISLVIMLGASIYLGEPVIAR